MTKEFEPGKTYRNSSGSKLTILACVRTQAYEWCWVAEDENGELRPVGIGPGYAENWEEVKK